MNLPQELLKIPHSSVLTARFSWLKNYILFDLVQGGQLSVGHIGDECAVREDTFMDMPVVGVGLQKGLAGCLVDDLQGDALYRRCNGVGRQLHQPLQ